MIPKAKAMGYFEKEDQYYYAQYSTTQLQYGALAVVVLGLGCLFLFYSYINGPAVVRRHVKRIKEDTYSGIVSRKQVDNHKSVLTTINEQNFNDFYEISLKYDVGDSLFKKQNSTIMQIYKKDTIITIDYNTMIPYYDSIYRQD